MLQLEYACISQEKHVSYHYGMWAGIWNLLTNKKAQNIGLIVFPNIARGVM